MLSLRNVSKKYVTKSKVETLALNDVNLDIADSGMVFVLGKSGSGKSTLLNLLGGLDAPTSGEIAVDGVSMSKFSPADYSNYRNKYVGFVFQEFNLLEDFNVKENVALALKLATVDDADSKVSQALKKVQLNDSYLSRRIHEMSGGEKQRIAIARAIIKDSKIILADEPTGNLDSTTSQTIWEILKELSQDRLVVVVSHDRESADKYADRIIEIADGKIVSDNGKQPEVALPAPAHNLPQCRLSFASRLKLGYHNLRLRKVKTVFVVLVAVFSILSLLITQILASNSSAVAMSKYIAEQNLPYFSVGQGRWGGVYIKHATKEYIAENSNYISEGVVESKQQMLDFGFTFVGEALELDDKSYYTTTSVIERCYNSGGGTVLINGQHVDIVKEQHPIEFLVGKEVSLSFAGTFKGYILAGVVDTTHIDGDYEKLEYSPLPRAYFTKNFLGIFQSPNLTFNSRGNDAVMYFGDGQHSGQMDIIHTDPAFEGGGAVVPTCEIIVTADGICRDPDEFKLAEGEVVLPYEIYSSLFQTQSKWYYVSNDLQTLNTPLRKLAKNSL